MISLMIIMLVLAVHSILIPGSSEGLKFYLLPDFNRMKEVGIKDTIVAAMNQALYIKSRYRCHGNIRQFHRKRPCSLGRVYTYRYT